MKKYYSLIRIMSLIILMSLYITTTLAGYVSSASVNTSIQKLRFYDAQSKKWYTTKIDSDIKKHDYNWSYLVHTKKTIQYNDTNYTIRKGIVRFIGKKLKNPELHSPSSVWDIVDMALEV